jgi:hypothetical protein
VVTATVFLDASYGMVTESFAFVPMTVYPDDAGDENELVPPKPASAVQCARMAESATARAAAAVSVRLVAVPSALSVLVLAVVSTDATPDHSTSCPYPYESVPTVVMVQVSVVDAATLPNAATCGR